MLLAPANPNRERERERERDARTLKSVVECVTSTLMDLCFIPLSFPRPLSSPSSNFSLVLFCVFSSRFSSFFFLSSLQLSSFAFCFVFFSSIEKRTDFWQNSCWILERPREQKNTTTTLVRYSDTIILY